MTLAFRVTESALADIEERLEYLERRSSKASLRLALELEGTFQFLAEWPEVGHLREDLTEVENVRFWTVGTSLVSYLVDSKPLIIVSITGAGQDVESILRTRFEQL